MIKNYFKVDLSNLKKNKAFSFINIFGGAVRLGIMPAYYAGYF